MTLAMTERECFDVVKFCAGRFGGNPHEGKAQIDFQLPACGALSRRISLARMNASRAAALPLRLVLALLLAPAVWAAAPDSPAGTDTNAIPAEMKQALADLKKDSPLEKLKWRNGPGVGNLDGRAKVTYPAEYRFVDGKGTRELLEMTGNTTDGSEIGTLEHKEEGWWVIFEFQDIGYVKDDEKNALDADKLLASYQRGSEEDNKRRRKAGLPELNIVGWHTKPNYNDETKNLEWAIIHESGGEQGINHNVRLLGRKGVTKVTLVLDDAKAIDATLPRFRALLKDFAYTTGESYAEYKEGDKVAKYGLSALVLGGAAAGAYKLGLLGGLLGFFKKAWKLLIFAVAGLGAWIKNLVTGKRRPSDSGMQ